MSTLLAFFKICAEHFFSVSQAKAFDRQTSVLHYLVSIVQKNDEDVLKLSEDFIPVKAAERVAVDMLSQQLKEMTNGIKLVKQVVKKYASDKGIKAEESPEDELLSATSMGRFSLSAASKLQSLSNEFESAKKNFADLLQFFGEDSTMTPEAFFCTVNTFVSMFDQTRIELKRKEDAKVSVLIKHVYFVMKVFAKLMFCCVVSLHGLQERKMRIEEKRKSRKQAAENSIS